MDLYDESRSLIYIGPVMRRLKSDTGLTEKWMDLVAALLDNYCQICSPLSMKCLLMPYVCAVILVREEKRPNGVVARILVSRVSPNCFLMWFYLNLLQANSIIVPSSRLL